MRNVETVFSAVTAWIRINLLRVFQRFAWVEREQFELGSLVNLYLGFNGNYDLQNRLNKLEVLKHRTETVLRRYNVKAYRTFKALTFRVYNTRAFIEDLCNACIIVHRELIRAQNAYSQHTMLRKFVCLVWGKTSSL
jgi:hypothetical protein